MFLFVTQVLLGRDRDTLAYRSNSFFLEGLGNGGIITGYSVNYERKLRNFENGFSAFRMGASSDFYEYAVFPLLFNRIISRKGSNNLELGVGTALYFFKYRDGKIEIERRTN